MRITKEFARKLSEVDVKQLCEESNLTYYELRKLLLILLKINKDPVLIRVLNSLLQSLSALEVKNVSIPTVKRITKSSKKIFK